MGLQWLSLGLTCVTLSLCLVVGCSDVLLLLLSWSLHPSVLCSCQLWGYPQLGYEALWGSSYLEPCRKIALLGPIQMAENGKWPKVTF